MITQSVYYTALLLRRKKQQQNVAPFRVSKKKRAFHLRNLIFLKYKRHLLPKLVPRKILFFQVKLLI